MTLKDWAQLNNYKSDEEDEDLVLASNNHPDDLMKVFYSPQTKETQRSLIFQALCCQLYDATYRTKRKNYDTKKIVSFLQTNKLFFDNYQIHDYIKKKILKLL
jgi:hypothetical protein